MMAGFVAKWDFVSVENIDDYMAASGVPENMKEFAKQNKPSLEMLQDGDKWTIKTILADKINDVTFKIGEEFDTKSLQGIDMKATVIMEGDKMVEIQKVGNDETKVVRELAGDTLTAHMTTNGVTVTCKFKRT